MLRTFEGSFFPCPKESYLDSVDPFCRKENISATSLFVDQHCESEMPLEKEVKGLQKVLSARSE